MKGHRTTSEIVARLKSEGDDLPSDATAELEKLLGRSWNRVAEGAADFGYPHLEPPILTMAHTGVVGAFAVKGSDGPLAIVLDSSVFNFFDLLTKAIVLAMVDGEETGKPFLSRDTERVRRRLWDDEQVRMRFTDLLIAYLFDVDAVKARQWWPSAFVAKSAINITTAVEDFVVGHEYAHLVLGHCDRETRATLPVRGETVAATVLHRSLAQEIEADLYGFAFAGGAGVTHPRDLAFGIGLFFCALGTVADLLVYCGQPTLDAVVVDSETHRFLECGGTHPPPMERLRALRRGIQSLFSSLPGANWVVDLIDEGFSRSLLVWTEVSPLLMAACRRMREMGYEPHERWDGYI